MVIVLILPYGHFYRIGVCSEFVQFVAEVDGVPFPEVVGVDEDEVGGCAVGGLVEGLGDPEVHVGDSAAELAGVGTADPVATVPLEDAVVPTFGLLDQLG